MGWRALNEDDLKYYLSGVELARLRKLGTQIGDMDPVPGILVAAAEYVRGYIKATSLGAAGTLPPTLIYTGAQIASWQCISWAGARGDVMDPKGIRRAQYDDAETYLRTVVAAGKIAIEASDIATSSPTYAVVSPSYSGRYLVDTGTQGPRESEFGRENEDGL